MKKAIIKSMEETEILINKYFKHSLINLKYIDVKNRLEKDLNNNNYENLDNYKRQLNEINNIFICLLKLYQKKR